jgi:ABC-type Fe3+/spermidine/putrescine transport system ATPase subunit
MSVLVVTGLNKRFGKTTVVNGVDFSLEQGEILVLLGPSGCGKTTTLRCVAGLEDADGGRIAIGGRVVVDDGIHEPAEKRGVGMVFQSYALWPHMTVEQNVGYTLRLAGKPRPEIAQRVGEALELVGLADFRARLPSELSGGQQQRVALARSLVNMPSVLLLDEPLSNLDAKLRERMRIELRSLIKRLSITALYVTHDQAEALAIADRVAVMQHGEIVQIDDPVTIYEKPRTEFVAQFLGTINLVPPTVLRQIVTPPAEFPDGPAYGIRAERIGLAAVADGDPPNVRGRIAEKAYLGMFSTYEIAIGGMQLLVHAQADYPVGSEVAVTLPADAVIPLERHRTDTS